MGITSLQKNFYFGQTQAQMMTPGGPAARARRVSEGIAGYTPTTKCQSQPIRSSLHLLVRTQTGPMTAKVQAYAGYLGSLLSDDPKLDRINISLDMATNTTRAGYDLVIQEEPRQSRLKRLVFGSPLRDFLERTPTSLLIARQPRWPLRQILLVVRSEEAHGMATNWTIRLAWASGAAITVLALVPQVSSGPSREVRLQPDLARLFAHHPPLERQMTYLSQQLQAWGLEASLRWRQGSPDQQIRDEFSAKSYDLVIIAAESKDWWLRRLLGESVELVLNRADCPVLITKSLIDHAAINFSRI